MKSKISTLLTAMTVLVALAIPVSLAAQDNHYITFNDPNAGTEAGQGTSVSDINLWGSIIGYYIDSSGQGHGFVRDPYGNFTTIDPQGSALTIAEGINPTGMIVGAYCTATTCPS